jgi:hypothetical protein
LKVVAELPAQRGEADLAAVGAVEQFPAQPALLLTDGLADTGLGHVQTFGRPAEMQHLGQRQEDLDVSKFHKPRLQS